jgi:beta-N-acetylhexosaminidase
MTPIKLFRDVLTVIACSFTYVSCAQKSATIEQESEKIVKPAFLNIEVEYVDSILSTLSIDEQIAQLLMVPIYSLADRSDWEEAEEWVRDLGLGGVICMQGGPENQRIRIQRLHELSEIPLMVASDAEWGLGMRLDSTRSFPRALTLGATRNAELVRQFGRIVGESLRSTGIQVNFAPVVDVNSNPLNPVIGSRSFSENVELVGELGLAYALGLQDEYVLATAKHFPGHGDSDTDSHKTLPRISGDRARLDSVELAPFQKLINGGVGAVMIAHLDIPALDSTDSQPSTLSPAIVDTLLRQELGFEGLAFTDALSMKGFADFAGDRPRARDALIAGNDILLFPGDPVKVIEEIRLAVENGEMDSTLIAAKCRRVLQVKVWSKADEKIPQHGENWEPENAEAIHRKILESSMTLLENKGAVLPWLLPKGNITVINVANKSTSGKPFVEHLKKTLGRSYKVDSYAVGKDCVGWDSSEIGHACDEADLVIVNFLETSNRPSRNYGILDSAVKECSSRISKSQSDSLSLTKWAVNLFGNPYALNDNWGEIKSLTDILLLAYQDDYRTQEAAVNAITGVGSANGKLPVTPIGLDFQEGSGLGLDVKVGERLGWDNGACRGSWGARAQIDSIVNQALEAGAFPGCRVVVAHKGRVIQDGAYGTTDGTVKVKESTIYDLASITKIVATTLCLMAEDEAGNLDVDKPLLEKLTQLDTAELGTRTYREILSHQAGLYPWIPFYLETLSDSLNLLSDRPICDNNICINRELFICKEFIDTIYKRIFTSELKPSGEYRYSDLGYYLIHKMLNSTYGTDNAIDSLSAARFYNPMGLFSMGFNPLETAGINLVDIAPTEEDTIFRKCTVQGNVHDPGAALFGGACGHAGVFSDAHDLTRLGQMLLNGGSSLGINFFDLKEKTVESWTKRAYPDGANRRGLGFDKPALEYDKGPTCNLASKASFGHSGFTGTLLWIDPQYDLVYVFLSNRTYPDSENNKLITMDVRTEIQRVIMEHLNTTLR